MQPTITSSSVCPCGSGNSYGECCQPLHQGNAAPTAERLMRSRYCAYTLGLIDYLIATTVPAQQGQLEVDAMRQWSEQSQWQGLTVENASEPPGATTAQVTFVARWQDPDGSAQAHRECSDFRLISGRWYFLDPNHPFKAGRNEPCPCGSGRKFKQCCAR